MSLQVCPALPPQTPLGQTSPSAKGSVNPQPGFRALCQLPPSLVHSDLPKVPHRNALSAPAHAPPPPRSPPSGTTSLAVPLLLAAPFPRGVPPACPSRLPTQTELSEGLRDVFLGFPPRSQPRLQPHPRNEGTRGARRPASHFHSVWRAEAGVSARGRGLLMSRLGRNQGAEESSELISL